MRIRTLIANLAFVSIAVACAIGQHNAPAIDSQPETAKQALARRHIELTTPSLLQALQSPESEVRELAAQVLAENKSVEAVPSIKQAMHADSVPENRVNMALFLAELGDPEGREALKRTCSDKRQPAHIRSLAAINMRSLHDEGCLDALLSLLKSSSADDADARVQALALLSGSAQVTEGNSQRVLEAMTEALHDAAPGVRMAASSALASTGQISAIPYLQAALEKEQNESCRTQLALDLQRLQTVKDSR